MGVSNRSTNRCTWELALAHQSNFLNDSPSKYKLVYCQVVYTSCNRIYTPKRTSNKGKELSSLQWKWHRKWRDSCKDRECLGFATNRVIQFDMELRVPQKKRRPWQPRNRRNRFSRWWSQKTGSLSESASGFSRLALMSQCLSLILPMPLIKTESEPIASDLLGRKCCLWRWNISTFRHKMVTHVGNCI